MVRFLAKVRLPILLLVSLTTGNLAYCFLGFHGNAPNTGNMQSSDDLRMSRDDMLAFAKSSAKKEFDGDPKGVVMWNPSESMLSVGIGHYLWGDNSSGESFKEMIRFVSASGCYKGNFPSVLKFRNGNIGDMPWKSRKAFTQHENDADVVELKKFLLTKDMQVCQVKFQIDRLKRALATMMTLEVKNPAFKAYVDELMKKPFNVQAMLDYVNFKGEGLGKKKSGGLYKVLLTASQYSNGAKAINKFKTAAEEVLRRRSDWAEYGNGWKKRIVTYGNDPNAVLI